MSTRHVASFLIRSRPISFRQLAMKACPYRATFYPKLGEPEAEVQKELDEWLTGLEKIVAQMEKFYKEGGHGTI
jgi:hypothetical protein